MGLILPFDLPHLSPSLVGEPPIGDCMNCSPRGTNCIGRDSYSLSIVVRGGAYFGAFCDCYGNRPPVILGIFSFHGGDDFPKGFLHR